MSACQPDQGVTIIALCFSLAVPVLGDRIDFGIALDMAEHGMADRRLAELARHRDMLRMIEVLVAEEDDLPFQEGVPHLLHLLRRQRLGQIHAADFRADMQGQRYDFDASRRLLG